MQKAKIRSIVKRKFRLTTDSEHKYAVMKNKLERNFKSGTTGKVWVSDITYIKTRQGWLYLAALIDLGDRKSNRLGIMFWYESDRNRYLSLQNGSKELAHYLGTAFLF